MNVRLRREPPRFRRVIVQAVEPLTPRMTRVAFTGDSDELDGLVVDHPAASVRLLLPSPGTEELVLPTWNGNEFLLPDGRRPIIRTFTPRLSGNGVFELDVVVHEGGAVSQWVQQAAPGTPAAVSGPGRGYEVDADAPAFLLAGDESAIPAIGQVLEALPPGVPVQVLVEVAQPEGRLPLPHHPSAVVSWHDLPPGSPPGDALVAAVVGADITPETRVWAAGEAAAVQRIRRHLFEERGVPRSHATIRGYWKHGRSGGADNE